MNNLHSNRNPRRWILWIIFILLACFVFATLLLPVILQRVVTGALNQSESYPATVGDIDVNLWRGAYQIHDIKIINARCKVAVPFFSAKTTDLSVEWRELFNGAFVGEIELRNAALNFIRGSPDCSTEEGEDQDWVATVKKLFPLKINRFAVSNSEIHYRDFNSEPQVNIFLKKVFAEASNLTNSTKLSKTLLARIKVHAEGDGSGIFSTEMNFDPYASPPTFELALDLKSLNLVDLNSLLRAYASVDVKKGELTMLAELSAKNGNYDGYVKPFLTDIEIFNLKEDLHHPFKLVWEAIVSAIATIFTNHSKDQLATRIPISGTFDNPNAGIWESVVYLSENAFIKALEPKFEGTLTFNSKAEKASLK